MALMECPVCDRKISDKAKSCPGCGTSMEEIKRIIEERENAPKIIVCPECGFEFKKTEEACPECGFPVELINGVEEDLCEPLDKITCIKCEVDYSIEEALCPNCGYPKFRITSDLFSIRKDVKQYINTGNSFEVQSDKRDLYLSFANTISSYAAKKNYVQNYTDYQAGDIIWFGRYELGSGVEPIEWKVLDKKDNKALVISKYALDCKKYNERFDYITWEKCTLRGWLNNEFMSKAFNIKEQAAIATTLCTSDKNPMYSTNPGNDTKDKIFLLSIKEAEQYFKSKEDRKCVPTDCAMAKGVYTNDDYTVGGKATCWWWLRSPGSSRDIAAYVHGGGSVSCNGNGVGSDNYAVRPALWINLKSKSSVFHSAEGTNIAGAIPLI